MDFPDGSDGKESACNAGDLGLEDSLEKGMAAHSRILAWRIPWTEEPSRLQSMGSQGARHDWATDTFTFTAVSIDVQHDHHFLITLFLHDLNHQQQFHHLREIGTETTGCCYNQPRQLIKKQRHYFASKGPSSQGYGFSSGHVWMWELDWRKLSAKELMLLKCGVGEDSWKSLGLQGDPTSPS